MTLLHKEFLVPLKKRITKKTSYKNVFFKATNFEAAK